MTHRGSEISEGVRAFLESVAKGEVLKITYLDIDEAVHELSIRETQEFKNYLTVVSIGYLQKRAQTNDDVKKTLKDVANDWRNP